ncbi:MAG: RdgB/HAM1 family non-canonical purine NTP pyrophosphatase [Xanthomonadales bacterium]|nr:RdgB/HAM1 family non-canonical purine NTP pyrophosphatase [Gammaproteobacteria bacterium]MBT8055081.1 RdgB/HAM1 family non-canonical purine NTP pyrophosphatase [Gammaproteobacteria bacterium]NND58234.1 RdgB/HAM1 family non-canonical purine NTP pyrophosphatase [Xanthomonadales bacterium]NNK51675.1 RdgB/HAM1 family non-canonical purine NTP pyrophosphatase [Xanthomonadales bacterium]
MAPPARELVLASGNQGKLRELGAMLDPHGWTVIPQSRWKISEADENGLSFIENALIKARHASSHTGLPALGDDSGLVVDALNGAPGIFSARYAGHDANDQANIDKLLTALGAMPEADRTAHFYCAMALVRHADDPAPLLATGRWDGQILETPAGTGGFGYDPVFWVPTEQCSAAELPPGVKNRLSHRGLALTALLEQMTAF